MGLPLVHENHYLLPLEVLETTLWGCVSTKGMNEICARGHSSEGKQEEALPDLGTSTQMQE